jgi:hypothetical protein
MKKFNQIPQGIRGIQQKVKFYIPSGSEETQLSDDPHTLNWSTNHRLTSDTKTDFRMENRDKGVTVNIVVNETYFPFCISYRDATFPIGVLKIHCPIGFSRIELSDSPVWVVTLTVSKMERMLA